MSGWQDPGDGGSLPGKGGSMARHHGAARRPHLPETCMSPASMLYRSALAVAAALAITLSGATSAAADTTPPREAQSSERAIATAHPALVRVTGTFIGWVHDRQGTYTNNGQPYTITFTCSGFGVHPDGYLATVGHCVDANDVGVRDRFIRAAAEDVVA